MDEGEYSTYSLRWTSSPSFQSYWVPKGSFVTSNETKALFLGGYNTLVFNILDGSYTDLGYVAEIFSSAEQWSHKSLNGKYVATVDDAQTSVYIYKDGVFLQKIDIFGSITHFLGTICSSSGKYILILADYVTPNTRNMLCYEGS